MSVELEIADGNPWYLSNNLWTGDTDGNPGAAIAGTPTYMWARVRNNGTTDVQNATVRFYWANPSVGIDRTTATLVGSSFVTLASGEEKDVLCLTAWVPTFVNGGHECLLGEAFHSSDPLPPGTNFDVPNDRHVAQRNIAVALAFKSMFHFTFEIHNPSRKEQVFAIRAEQGPLERIEKLREHLGKTFPKGKDGRVSNLGFVAAPCPTEADLKKAKPQLDRIVVPANGRAGATLVGTLDGQAALVHVVQHAGEREVGGLAVVVVQGKE